MKKIIEKSIEQSFSYSEYRVLVHDLLIEGKSTGFNQTESLTNFSLLNHKRMSRLVKDYKDKNGNLTSEFKQDLQIWYNKNKGICIQKDLINILRF